MFSIPKVNIITSDEGFSVEVLGRTGIKYREIDLTAFIDGEVLAGPSGLVIYRDSIKLDRGSAGVQLDEKKKNEIIDNIKRAFAFRGYDIEIY